MFFAALTPLLPHYADELGLSKAGGAARRRVPGRDASSAAIPAGIVAARLGVKPRGADRARACSSRPRSLFGLAHSEWLLDTARFAQGVSSSFTWTAGSAWLDRRGACRAARGADRGGVRGGDRRRALRPGARRDRVASPGPAPAFGGVAVARRRDRRRRGADAAPPRTGRARSRSRRSGGRFRDRRVVTAMLVRRPARAAVRDARRARAAAALRARLRRASRIGATWLIAAAPRGDRGPVIGRISDRRGRVGAARARGCSPRWSPPRCSRGPTGSSCSRS